MNALAKKLQMKPDQQWLICNAPAGYPDMLEPLPVGLNLSFSISKPVDGVQLFVNNKKELAAGLESLTTVLTPTTVLWVVYPKKNSGIITDLEMMGSWDEASKHGLRPVASAAIDQVWTALRFKPSDQTKGSDTRNEAVQNNEYGAYIDVVNKKVTLPPEIVEVLQQAPAAYTTFEKLAYSHKKEYVLWILSAKQEKTKLDRLNKMRDMLLAGKKNPSAK
jgi:hypothetical protein